MLGSPGFWLVSVGAALFIFGCGGDEPAPKPFTYTAVPYTIVALPSGTPIAVAISDDGDRFVANEVLVIVLLEAASDFEHDLTQVGFKVGTKTPLSHTDSEIQYVVIVPDGAAPDALGAIETFRGVAHAKLNNLRSGLGE
jgi:hypothetical protein